MDQDNKVNLSDLNKAEKTRKLPSIKNPFKKQQGPRRDQLGQFTAGSGGLQFGKKLDLKRMVPVVAVVALVGGFFVFRSFADTKLYAYQYSVAKCSVNSSTKEVKNATCRDKSAEALTYRFYKGLLGRNPDSGGYKFWTQKLAGDRLTPEKVAQQMIDADKKVQQKSTAQFVEDLYKNMLLRNADSGGKKYWVDQLNGKKVTRQKAAAHFATTSEAITKQANNTTEYVKRLPRSTKEAPIVEVAKSKQAARAREVNSFASNAKIHYERGALHHQKQASGTVGKAEAQARPAAPSRAALTAIANLQKQAETNLRYAQESANNANNEKQKADKIFEAAKAVARYSPDIPAKAVQDAHNKAVVYANSANGKVSEIKGYISRITNSYKTAEGKYQAEQRRVAEAAQREKERQEQSRKQAASAPANSGSASAASCPSGYFRDQGACWSHSTANPFCPDRSRAAGYHRAYVEKIGPYGSPCYYRSVDGSRRWNEPAACKDGKILRIEGAKAVCRLKR